MNPKPVQQNNIIASHFLSVLNNIVLGILGIQIVVLLLPVRTGDKRFNQ
jgi:hypothetical protein